MHMFGMLVAIVVGVSLVLVGLARLREPVSRYASTFMESVAGYEDSADERVSGHPALYGVSLVIIGLLLIIAGTRF